MTKAEVIKRIKGLDEETQKKVVCALVGHSKIHNVCFGYRYCARCEEIVIDTLTKSTVIVGHDCPLCHSNYDKMEWKDTLFVPYPFKAKKVLP